MITQRREYRYNLRNTQAYANGNRDSARFLADDERAEVERRLKADHGHLSNDFDLKYVFQALRDWKIYIHMLICMAGFCPIYSFSLFLPTIVKNMGYTANNAQLMSVPPYVCACVFTIGASWVADRYRQRGVFLLGFQLVAIAGFAMLAGSGNASVQYTGTVFAAIGKIGYPRRQHESNSLQEYIHRFLSAWHGTAATSVAV